MAINKLTQEQLNFIKDNYGKLKAREIATLLDVSTNDIYKYWKKSGVSKQLNPTFYITERQRQILLGGIIGDGSFKKNGSNYYYRECHAIPEAEYLMWKFNELRNMTTGKIYNIPRRGINQNPQVSFQTVNSPTFNPYALMSIDDVIENIDELGILIWLLDDGWIRKNSNVCSYGVSAASFNASQTNKMINKLKEFGLNAHVIGRKNDLSLCSQNNKRIKELTYQYLPNTMDIVIKKINDLKVKE